MVLLALFEHVQTGDRSQLPHSELSQIWNLSDAQLQMLPCPNQQLGNPPTGSTPHFRIADLLYVM